MTNGNGTLKTITCGVAVAVIATMVIAMVTVLGTVRVNAAALALYAPRIERNECDISNVKGDLREIKAILERIEDKVEAK